jgi:hypothetical protein
MVDITRQVAAEKENVEKRQPIVCIRIKRIKPISSRIEELEVEQQMVSSQKSKIECAGISKLI